MRKVWAIAVREYVAAVCTKGFIIGLLLLPCIWGGSILMQKLLSDKLDLKEKRLAVIDRTAGGEFYSLLEAAAETRNKSEIFDPETGAQEQGPIILEPVSPSENTPDAVNRQRYDLSERVRQEELFGFIEIMPDVFTKPATTRDDDAPVRFQCAAVEKGKIQRWLERTVNDIVLQRRFADKGLPLAEIRALQQPVKVAVKGLTDKDEATGEIKDSSEVERVANFIVPMAAMGMMFLVVLGGATPLLQGTLEEKMQRIAEVLLGSVQPLQLMMGKLLGMSMASLTGSSLYLATAYWAAHHYGFSQLLPWSLLAWFLAYMILALLMFGSIFFAVGAACNDAKDTQTLMTPIMIIVVLPMMLFMNITQEPNSPLSVGLSFFPLATPMVMTARVAASQLVPWWQPALGILITLATTLFCLYAAGRIFRVGILMQGKGARLTDLARWIIRG